MRMKITNSVKVESAKRFKVMEFMKVRIKIRVSSKYHGLGLRL